MNTRNVFSGLLGVAVVLLVGCGDSNNITTNPPGGGNGGLGGYSGSTAPAVVTSNNAEEIGTDSTKAVSQAISAESSGTGSLPFGVSIARRSAAQQAQAIHQQVMDTFQGGNLPIGITLDSTYFSSMSGYCGGSVTIPDSYLSSGSSGNGTITYNNFCLDLGNSGSAGPYSGKMTINGTITVSGGGSTYNNFTAKFENGTLLTCNSSGCSSSSVYAGSGGKTYQVSGANVSGNSSAGYTVNATFCQSGYGCLTIKTDNPVLFNCSNGHPGSGAISFSSTTGSSGKITFDSCTSYTVTYTTTAGSSVASISGTW